MVLNRHQIFDELFKSYVKNLVEVASKFGKSWFYRYIHPSETTLLLYLRRRKVSGCCSERSLVTVSFAWFSMLPSQIHLFHNSRMLRITEKSLELMHRICGYKIVTLIVLKLRLSKNEKKMFLFGKIYYDVQPSSSDCF